MYRTFVRGESYLSALARLKIAAFELFVNKSYIYIYIYIYKQNFPLNNPQGLICRKTTNQRKNDFYTVIWYE